MTDVKLPSKEKVTPAHLRDMAECAPGRLHRDLLAAADEIERLRGGHEQSYANGLTIGEHERDKLEDEVARLCKELAETRQDLTDARNGWEAAVDAVRTSDEKGDERDPCVSHLAMKELQSQADEFAFWIDNWLEAYPLDMFPLPDWIRVAEALKAAGLSLDCVSAANFRHVLIRVKERLAAQLEPARAEEKSAAESTAQEKNDGIELARQSVQAMNEQLCEEGGHVFGIAVKECARCHVQHAVLRRELPLETNSALPLASQGLAGDASRAESTAQGSTIEPFVVKHYISDERPIIKGNGFDGLMIGEDRYEADEFVAWINARLQMNGNDLHKGNER